METRTINVYEFKELSAKAEDQARYDAQANGDWHRADEYLKSIKAMAAHFGGHVVDYSIDWTNSTSPSSMKFDMPEDMDAKEIGKRLMTLGAFNRKTLMGDGDCKLTGWCYDENAIDGFRLAFLREKEHDLNALMQAAFDSWLKDSQADAEYQYKDEIFNENCEANDYEFNEDGSMA